MKIALIGAGAAGAACVSVLRSRGAEFYLFEKSRGPGGRLSTRRVSGVLDTGDLSYDHGAPFFSWSTDLTSELSPYIRQTTLENISDNQWIAKPNMPQLVKDLLGEQKNFYQTEIDVIEGHANELFLIEKSDSQKRHGPFQSVVITAPAPQASALLRKTNCAWKSALANVTYAPCWTLMLTLKDPCTQVNSTTLQAHPFNDLLRQHDKAGRPQHPGLSSWVGHASAQWSEAHLEQTGELVQAELLGHALDALGASAEQILHATVHRWRFSTVKSSLSEVCLADSELGLFYASDACLGSGVAGSVRSGLKVGQLLTAP